MFAHDLAAIASERQVWVLAEGRHGAKDLPQTVVESNAHDHAPFRLPIDACPGFETEM